jgi:SsrA-binding protein
MKTIIENRKAHFNYTITDKFIAGIQLTGTEIKSVRNGGVNFNDSFCLFINDELIIRGLYISDYGYGTQHENVRDKKLLLTKKELKKIKNKITEKKLTVVPVKGFISSEGFFKIEIGVGKGKQEFDKRETIKKRDIDRELKRI